MISEVFFSIIIIIITIITIIIIINVFQVVWRLSLSCTEMAGEIVKLELRLQMLQQWTTVILFNVVLSASLKWS